ncbi:phage protein NinX family protein [Pseudomonas sp. TE3-3-F2023]|uniref:phage protein NinX family protein n=1 Tax=Pseudomonas sp. TE3-3-F2023 TaxID=3119004 RepID=UPI0030D2456D
MTDLIEVRVSNLVGEALGWAVGKAESLDLQLAPPGYNGVPWRVFARYQGQAIEHTRRYNPWEDWALGGPLIDKYEADFQWVRPGMLRAVVSVGQSVGAARAETHLLAAGRAIVSAALGDTVQVPTELINDH